MKIKRFFAEDMRQALKQVREALGPDAVILSNRRVDGGVELVTAVDYDPTAIRKLVADNSAVAGLSEKPAQTKANTSRKQRVESPLESHPLLKEAVKAKAKPKSKPKLKQKKPKAKMAQRSQQAAYSKNQQQQESLSGAQVNQLMEKSAPAAQKYDLAQEQKVKVEWSEEPTLVAMREELTSLRGLLEHQLSGLAWADMERRSPSQVMLLRRLSEMGLEASVCRKIVKSVQAKGGIEHLWRQALRVLSKMLKVSSDDVLLEGGVFALLGPTGVGKTTTIAKLAARYALHHGANEVALITTDTYRIAAHEQLKTYGRILGVPVRMVSDAALLRSALHEFRDRRLVLVDTAGMSQHDERLKEQLHMLYEGGPQVKRYLALSATSQSWVLKEAIEAFEPDELDGCIITKLDESTTLGSAMSIAIEYGLPVAYITDGQKVPEDLKVARAHNLINRALVLMQKRHREVTDDALAKMFIRSEEYEKQA